MLIDVMTGRDCFASGSTALSVIIYILAAIAAMLLYRWGRAHCEKKHGVATQTIPKILINSLPSGIWNVTLFLLTGCLRFPASEMTEDKRLNKKIFLSGIGFLSIGTAGAYVLYTVLQLLASLIGGGYWAIPMLIAKALTCAGLSLLIFSHLPLPGSDCESCLRKKPLSPRQESFRKNGTWPFFLFCTLALLLACIAVPLPNGQVCSLSGIVTLFPILLIGG